METEVYIERSLEKEILKYIGVKEIIAVVGTRQCGKTTMANHILDNLEKKKLRIKRISFDNIKDLKIFEDDIDLFIENYVR
ncbi:MAG: AAA family ATPase, partial [Nanoarchaeota archaeon]|nr:AAA family ATPase [Nanoarchaeota archaeon]